MKRRLLSVFAATILLFSLFPRMTLLGHSEESIWDGTVSNSFASGTGTAEDPYVIETAEQLAFLAQSVNDGNPYASKYFRLDADLALNDTTDWSLWNCDNSPANSWTPIGSESYPFLGHFDGGGHKITGIYINSEQKNQGVFGFCYNNIIQNLSVSHSYIKGGDNTGSIVGYAYKSNIQNCDSACILQSGINYIGDNLGGIVGYSNESRVIGCFNSGSIEMELVCDYSGGVVGWADSASELINCYNIGEVVGNTNGGVVGYLSGESTITDCYNAGRVSGNHKTGGVVGALSYSTVMNCYNTDSVIGANSSNYVNNWSGGVVGYALSGIVTDSYNSGTVTGDCVGGVIGYIDFSGTISGCFNEGVVTGIREDVGGVIGWCSKGSINECYNTGYVAGKKDNLGGVVGRISSHGSVNGCFNTGTVVITGERIGEHTGGVVGYTDTCTITNCYNEGNVTGGITGGVIGDSEKSDISNCFNTGTINGFNCGGVIGAVTRSSTVCNCYNIGSIQANGNAGGVIGSVYNSSTCQNCYNTGSIICDESAGGIFGYVYRSTVNCGYNVGLVTGAAESGGALGGADSTSTTLFCYYLNTCIVEGNNFGASRSEEQMQTSEMYFGFDFDQVWTMDGNPIYPYPELNGMTHVQIGIPFVDVEESDYYFSAVEWAVAQGITAGTSETTFSPSENCTRSQIVTFLWRASGSPEPSNTEIPFTDVWNTDAWYYKAVLWAYENGITNGVSAHTFGVNQSCSRAQIVTFLWRLAGSSESTLPENVFSDVPSSVWYADAVRWAVENEITAGTSATTFSPYQICTRAEAVMFLYKAVG